LTSHPKTELEKKFTGNVNIGSETLIVSVVGDKGAMTEAVLHEVNVTENRMKLDTVP
jgi:hypothetical protein